MITFNSSIHARHSHMTTGKTDKHTRRYDSDNSKNNYASIEWVFIFQFVGVIFRVCFHVVVARRIGPFLRKIESSTLFVCGSHLSNDY